MYILLTRISNVTFNPQLVLFDRLPYILPIYHYYSHIRKNQCQNKRAIVKK